MVRINSETLQQNAAKCSKMQQNAAKCSKMQQNAAEAVSLLKSMSHPARLMVLWYLLAGECPVSELNRAVPLSQPALSQHLAALRQADLVETRRDGQAIYYRLKSQAVSGVLEAFYESYCNPKNKEEQS